MSTIFEKSSKARFALTRALKKHLDAREITPYRLAQMTGLNRSQTARNFNKNTENPPSFDWIFKVLAALDPSAEVNFSFEKNGDIKPKLKAKLPKKTKKPFSIDQKTKNIARCRANRLFNKRLSQSRIRSEQSALKLKNECRKEVCKEMGLIPEKVFKSYRA